MRSRSTLQVFAVGTVLVLASCTDQTDPAAPTNETPAPALAARQGQGNDPNALGRVVPGFGGFFLDAQGVPTVYLKDARRRGDAELALAPYLRTKGGAVGRLQVRQGDYDWVQLERWFSEASAQALAQPGAVYVDADESSNRVRIGAERGAGNRIRGSLARLGIPGAAVVIEEMEPVRFAAETGPRPKAKPGGGQSLQGQVRPIIGGVQINFPGFLCTLGFNAGGSFITNSHCTNVQGGTEGTPYWQPTSSIAPTQIATEAADPTYFSGRDGCPSGRVCRFSDASRAAYQQGAGFTVGRIAKTQKPGRSLTITGSFTIGREGAAVQGSVVNKVGRTTGWSQGQVTNVCVNTNVSGTNITQLCQNFVSATVGSGDSGSPVFEIDSGTDVGLVGILWGGSGSRTFVFSPLSQVEDEIGALSTTF
jgi:hypothetical protein